jgi:hypothetical protein
MANCFQEMKGKRSMDPDGGDRDGEAKSYPDYYYRAYRNLSLIARNYALPSECSALPPQSMHRF